MFSEFSAAIVTTEMRSGVRTSGLGDGSILVPDVGGGEGCDSGLAGGGTAGACGAHALAGDLSALAARVRA